MDKLFNELNGNMQVKMDHVPYWSNMSKYTHLIGKASYIDPTQMIKSQAG